MITKPVGINTLIAEHIFGWKWDKHWAGGCWIIPKRYRDWDSGEPQVSPPNFTEDIADAWQVVEKLTAMGFHFLLLKSADSGLSIATFYMGPQDRSDDSKATHEAPLAICKAALKACGVDVDSPK